jgi:20S proteasome subunit beta 2
MFKNTVSDRNCEKIHNMAPDFYCCGAGTAADTEAVTGFQPGMGSLFKSLP